MAIKIGENKMPGLMRNYDAIFPSPTVPTPQAATISNPQMDIGSPIGRNSETFFQQLMSVSQSVKLEN
jgi:hypothetical protein